MISDAIKFVHTNKEKLGMPTKEENKGSKESKDCSDTKSTKELRV